MRLHIRKAVAVVAVAVLVRIPHIVSILTTISHVLLHQLHVLSAWRFGETL